MDAELWKSFEDNPVTHSVAHHLMAIAELRAEHGYARVSDVARRLGITRGSVSLTLKTLKQRGLVVEDANRFVELSDGGRELVRAIQAKQSIVGEFLAGVLDVDAAQAAEDACKIEHLISHEMASRMLRFLQLFRGTSPSAASFRRAWARARRACPGTLEACPTCEETCLQQLLGSPLQRGDDHQP